MEAAKVAEYYDVTLGSYRKFWYGDSSSYALHLGLWETDTKTLDEALLNTNKFMAETGAIKASDVVLDAGCGVGGSSIWLAKNIGCKVIGLTLSQRQQQEATKLAKENGVEHLTEFMIKDYINTGFADQSFDVVWGLESICYAESKLDFLKEAFRLLRKGGRVLVCDVFKLREVKNKEEERDLQKFEEGFVLPPMILLEDFRKDLERANYQNIAYFDKSKEVMPSAKKAYNVGRFTYPLMKFINLFKVSSQSLKVLDKNAGACLAQYKLIIEGVDCYGLFYGEK